MFIFLDFHPEHVIFTYKYWKRVDNTFRRFFLQAHGRNTYQSTYHDSNYVRKQSRLAQQKKFMNKQPKKLKEDEQIKRIQVKLRIKIVLVMLLIIAIILGTQLLSMTALQDLENFENDGFFFLKYFPVASIVARGCVEKYYTDIYPSEDPFYPDIFED